MLYFKGWATVVHKTRTDHPLSVFLFAVLVYSAVFSVNDLLIRTLQDVPGADLFRLSTGVKLLLVLLTGWIGSAAITVFCFVWCALVLFPDNYLLAAQVAAAGGLMPQLACQIFRRKLASNLSGLTWQVLAQLSVVFAALNGLVRESIVFMHLGEGELVSKVCTAFINDLLGIFFALYAFRYILIRVDLPKPQSK